MKKLFAAFFFIGSLSYASAQSSCCTQVIVTKSNNPFACLTSRQDSTFTFNGSSFTVKNLTLAAETWAYQGKMIKLLSVGAMGEPALRPGYYFVFDDACNLVCGTEYEIYYNGSYFTNKLGYSTCNPPIISFPLNFGSISIINATKIN